MKNLQGSLVNIIYKENVKLPNEVLLAVTLSLNVTFNNNKYTTTQVVLTPSSSQKEVAIVDPTTGQTGVMFFKLLLPVNGTSPTFDLLYKGAKEKDWEVLVNGNSTGL